jgi:hypothetical protein
MATSNTVVASDAARALAKLSIETRRKKWGDAGFRLRMREWGKLGVAARRTMEAKGRQ